MSSLFERIKGRREPTSAEIAKERLKLVLVTDRSDLSPEKLEEMQTEIIEVIKRYIPIDDADVQIKLEQRDRKNYLVADIPLYRDHTYQVAEKSESPESPDAVAAVVPESAPDQEEAGSEAAGEAGEAGQEEAEESEN
jgi:cell division topological specificity factor